MDEMRMAEVMKRYELNINTCFGQGMKKGFVMDDDRLKRLGGGN